MNNITTYSGISFDPTNPDIDSIKIEDIAHALSMMCRANGHFKQFFSVAQHCLNCAYEASERGYSKRIQLACLIHDASEAYISDITRPVKAKLTEYHEIEENLQNTIYLKFLDEPLSEEEKAKVKEVDDDMLIAEFNALMDKKIFDETPELKSEADFGSRMFSEVEGEFSMCFSILSESTHLNP